MAFTTSYQNKFSGTTIAPANTSFNLIGVGGADWVNPVELVWPIPGQNGPYFSADTVQLAPPASVVAPLIRLPRGDQVSNGQTITFVNTTNSTIVIASYTGASTVVTVAANSTAEVTLTDNTTQQGTWLASTFTQSGAVVNLASLAGQGLIATLSPTNEPLLNTRLPVSQRTGDILASDFSNTLNFSVIGTYFLPSLASLTAGAQFQNGWFVGVKNIAGGDVVISPAGADMIDGVAQSKTIVDQASAFFIAGPGSTWIYFAGSSGGGGGITYSSRSFTMVGSTSTLPSNNTATFIDLNGTPARGGNQPPVLRVPAKDQLYIFRNLTTPSPVNPDGSIQVLVNTITPGLGLTIPNGGFTVAYSSATSNTVVAGFNYPIFPGGQSVIPGPGTEAGPTLYFTNDVSTGLSSSGIDWSAIFSANGIQAWRVWDDLASGLNGKHFEVGKPDGDSYDIPNYRRLEVYGDRKQQIFNYHTVWGNAQFQNKVTSVGGIDGGVI